MDVGDISVRYIGSESAQPQQEATSTAWFDPNNPYTLNYGGTEATWYDGGASSGSSGWNTKAFGSSGSPTSQPATGNTWNPTSANMTTPRSPIQGGGATVGGGASAGNRTTTRYLSGGDLPSFTTPTYEAPEYDYSRVNYLQRQQAAPQYNKLQNALYSGLGKINATENPYMQQQGRRALLSGYGEGVGNISADAYRSAQGLYNTEYQGNVTSASKNFDASLASAQALYQAAIENWKKSFTTEVVNEPNYALGGATVGSTTTNKNLYGG
jgi:hypothetical protein